VLADSFELKDVEEQAQPAATPPLDRPAPGAPLGNTVPEQPVKRLGQAVQPAPQRFAFISGGVSDPVTGVLAFKIDRGMWAFPMFQATFQVVSGTTP
jgi:hypothetical protein